MTTEIKNLKMQYGEKTVLDISSLSIKKGEITVLLGANGSGKSTLLQCIAGTRKPTEGDIITQGTIKYSPQFSYMFSGTTADNIAMGINLKGKEKKEKLKRQLNDFLLTEISQQKAQKLSGGEKQRVAAARIMAEPCDILLLDEPTASADKDATILIENKIREFRDNTGCSVIMSTHSIKEATALADRIIILDGGHIIKDGSTEIIKTELLSFTDADLKLNSEIADA